MPRPIRRTCARRPRSRRWPSVPLILADASYGAEDPMRRQLAELAQRVGVSIQPQIDVEDIEAALELAARGLGDTIVSRGILLAMGRRVSKRLGWVPFDEPFYTTFAFVSRANAPLSPASREFLGLARDGLAELARRLRTDPPRQRTPG